MKKFIKIFCLSLFSILIPYYGYPSSLVRDLTEYDYEDIKEVARLCHVAVENQSFYFEELRDHFWDITFLTSHTTLFPYGIKACNGPLTVIAYNGLGIDPVDGFQTFFGEMEDGDEEGKNPFPKFKEVIDFDKGIDQHYMELKEFRSANLLKDFDPDEKLILTGYDVGGALAICGAMDLLYGQQHRSEIYPEKFCSLLTFGCPLFCGASFQSYLVQRFSGTSHLRMFFEKEPIYNEGEEGGEDSLYLEDLLYLENLNLKIEAYAHCGRGVPLPAGEKNDYSCFNYIKCLDERPSVL
jgi:hypothetical protein